MDGRMMRDGEWVPRDYKNFDNGNKTSLVSLDTQIHRYTDTQIHRYRDTQIHRYTGTQIHRYTNTQITLLFLFSI